MRGFIFSLDVLVSISILLLLAVFLVGLSFTFSSPELVYQRLYLNGKDSLNLMQNTRIGNIMDFSSVQDLFSDGILVDEDKNKTVLDIIGSLWASENATELQHAAVLVEELFGKTMPERVGYSIAINGDVIYQKNLSKNETFLARLSTTASGFERGKPVSGFVSRALITKANKLGVSYGYLGGFVGNGNVTRTIEIPAHDSIEEAYLEMDSGSDIKLFINNEFSGSYAKNSQGNLSADKWLVGPQYFNHFVNGSNNITLDFDDPEGDFVGGGLIKVSYTTSQLVTEPATEFGQNASARYWYPGIHGLINLFSSFYVPGTLNNLSAFISYFNNISVNGSGAEMFATIGGTEIYRNDSLGNVTVFLNDTNLRGLLDFASLGKVTIPIRFGTDPVSIAAGVGTSDSVLTTDLSGSMVECDVSTQVGPCDCNAPAPCDREKVKVAKEVDSEFISAILNFTGNRVGLVTYGTDVSSCTGSTASLTDDFLLLNNTVGNYSASCGATCIACGITSATDKLTALQNLVIQTNSIWKYSTAYPAIAPPDDLQGDSWTELGYDDSSWASGEAILGFDLPPTSIPQVTTDIGDNGGNYFFRKVFNISNLSSIAYGSVRVTSDDRADVYFNGNLIDSDAQEHDAQYYNRPKVVFLDSFESGGLDGTYLEAENNAEFQYANGYQTSPQCYCFGTSGKCIRHSGSTVQFANATFTFDLVPGTYNLTFGYCPESDSNPPHDEYRLFVENSLVDNWFASEKNDIWTNRTVQNLLLDTNDNITISCDRSALNTNCNVDYMALKSQVDRWVVDSVNDGGVVTISNSEAFSGSSTLKFYGDNSGPNSIWVEREFNLSGKKGLRLSYYWAIEDFERDDGDYAYLDIYDGAWHNEVRKHSGWKDHSTSVTDYMREDVNLDAFNLIEGFKIRFRATPTHVQNDDTFLVDLVQITQSIYVDPAIINDGDNVIAVKLYNNDSDAAKFDLSLNVNENRFESIIVMSDGYANRCVPGAACDLEDAKQEATERACIARNEWGLAVFSVAFGNSADTEALNKTACWDCGAGAWIPNCDRFFVSSDAEELKGIYSQIVQDLINLSLEEQTLEVFGDVSLDNVLLTDSYIEYNYTSDIHPPGFGDVAFTLESPRFVNSTGPDQITNSTLGIKEGIYFVPINSRVLDAKATSYSSEFWTDRLYTKNSTSDWTNVYWLANFSAIYSDVGDPYIVNIPIDLIEVGMNNSVGVGVSPFEGDNVGGSLDSRVIYTVLFSGVNLQGFSDVFPKGKGSTVTVHYDINADDIWDDSSIISIGPEPSDIFDPQNDSVDDAFMRLLDNLNIMFDKNANGYGDGTPGNEYDGVDEENPIDLQITSEISFDSAKLSGIPSLWGPAEIEVRVWG